MEPRANDKPFRVLQLAESPYMGGITSHVAAIAQSLEHSTDFDCVVATLPGRRPDRTLVDLCARRGVAVHTFPMAFRFDARVIGALRRFLAERRIDLIHTHNYRATLLAALAAGSVPVVNTCHGETVDGSPKLRAWQWAELLAMRRHALTIAVSDHVRQWLIGQGLGERHIRVVHNGFDPPDRTDRSDQSDRSVTRESLGIAPENLVALYVGRLAEGKGVGMFLDALEGLRGVTAVIAGDGPLRTTLERQARASRADARFLGFQIEPGPFYTLADVVVLPSAMEALPMTLIEAAAYGKPVVASAVGGILEVVRDGETGFLTPPGDVPQLRLALERCKDPALRATLGRQAQARWQTHFSLARFSEELVAVYREILDA
jgi:glycosyltransferase involved in cell wall biosynthesis